MLHHPFRRRATMLKTLIDAYKTQLRIKMLIQYSIAFLLVMILVYSLTYWTVNGVLRNKIEEGLANDVSSIKSMIETAVQTSIKNHLRTTAEVDRDAASNFYEQYQEGLLTEAQAKALSIEVLGSQQIARSGYVYILDSQGTVLWHKVPELIGTNISEYAFVRKQLADRKGYIEYRWKNPNEPSEREKAVYMTYFEPWDWIISVSGYRDEFPQLVNISDFEDKLNSVRFGKDGYPSIMDTKGTFLLHPQLKGRNLILENDPQAEIINKVIKLRNAVIDYTWKNPGEATGRNKITVVAEYPEYGWIIAATSYKDDFYAPLYTVRWVFAAALCISLMLVLFLTFRISRGITGPIMALKDTLTAGADGDLSVRVTIAADNEIGVLGSYFNGFMESLEARNKDLELAVLTQTLTAHELKNLNENLETRVSERTEMLNESMENLRETQRQLLRDIAGRERAEKELIQARDAAERANHAKSEFLAKVSHELRTPLSGIMGILQFMLQFDRNSLTTEQIENLTMLKDSAMRLLTFINKLLDISKAEAGVFVVELGPVITDEILYNKKALFDGLIKSSSGIQTGTVEFRIIREPGVPTVFLGDEGKLNQVLINLIANAVKFTVEGAITLSIAMDTEHLIFEVTDTGAGIRSDQLPDIFEQYTQAHTQNPRNMAGSGLGLSLCKELMELMDGDIHIISEEGIGTTARIILPYRQFVPDAEFAYEPSNTIVDTATPDNDKLRHWVLVVDDNPIGRHVIQLMLQDHYQLEFATTGKEAVERFDALRPGVVLLDVQLPDMSGYDVLDCIRETALRERIPVFALTAMAFEHDRQALLDYGFSDYLSKPVDMELLYSKLNSVFLQGKDS